MTQVTGQPPLLDHLRALLDSTGIAQHATYAVVAREHGYCLDDNARGLILATTLPRTTAAPSMVPELHARTAAFVQHAWNEDTGRFRNFMSFDRRWLEAAGSEDSHGRTIWALGTVVQDGHDDDARAWAVDLLRRAVPAVVGFTSPRALAFSILGLVAAGDALDGTPSATLCERLATRLCNHLADHETAEWRWFEASLTYDNARLPHALLAAGARFGRCDWHDTGLRTLTWLVQAQTAEAGHFRPVGSNGFWSRGGIAARFDQQPIEAAASVAACLCAHRHSGQVRWLVEARKALAWFHGGNDLQLPLARPATGGCCDGLHPDRVNANQGAESTLAWLQAETDMRAAERLVPVARRDEIQGAAA